MPTISVHWMVNTSALELPDISPWALFLQRGEESSCPMMATGLTVSLRWGWRPAGCAWDCKCRLMRAPVPTRDIFGNLILHQVKMQKDVSGLDNCLAPLITCNTNVAGFRGFKLICGWSREKPIYQLTTATHKILTEHRGEDDVSPATHSRRRAVSSWWQNWDIIQLQVVFSLCAKALEWMSKNAFKIVKCVDLAKFEGSNFLTEYGKRISDV